jgi:hypothetical protein
MITVLILNLSLGFWLVYKSVLYWLNEEYCREYCFPYNYDMMDEETCACWLDDGSIEVKEVEYE